MPEMAVTISVALERAGTWATAAASAGDTSLALNDAAMFTAGASVLVGGSVLDVSSVEVDEDDGLAGTLTLDDDTPLPVDVTVGAPVYVSPDVWTKTATVMRADKSVIEVDVPSHTALWADPRLAETATGGQPILIEVDTEAMTATVVGFPAGDVPTLTGRHITASSLPPDAVDDAAWQAQSKVVALLNAADQSGLSIRGAVVSSGQTGDGQSNVVIAPNGLSWSDATTGASLSVSSTAGSRPILQGIIARIFRGLFDNVEVGGNLEVLPGGHLILGDKIPSPSAPNLTMAWPMVATDAPYIYDPGKGFCYYDSLFWTQMFQDDGHWWIVSIDPATGDQTQVKQVDDISFSSLCHNDSGWWLLVTDGDTLAAVNYDDTWAATGKSINYTALTNTGPGRQRPAMCASDSTHIAIADFGDDRVVKIAVYATSTPTQIPTVTTLSVLPATWDAVFNIGSVVRGDLVFDGAVWMLAPFDSTAPMIVTPDSGSHWVSNDAFQPANGDEVWAACWNPDATPPGGDSADGTLVSLSGPADAVYLATYSWLLSGAFIEPFNVACTWYQLANGYETTVGDYSPIRLQNGCTVVVDPGTMPGIGGSDDPDRSRVYLSNTGHSRTDYFLTGTSDAGTGVFTITSIPSEGDNPPADSSFPTGTPGDVELSDGTVIVEKVPGESQVKIHAVADPVEDQDPIPLAWGLANLGGGSTVTGGIDIDCGDSTAAGVDIDCGSS